MSAARTTGAGRGDAASRRSRAGRTLVALLGVSSIALTAAAAQPLGPRDVTRPGDVFALGEGGLGAIELITPEPEEGTAASGRSGRSVGSAGDLSGTGGAGVPGADLGSGFGFDPAVEVPVLGEEFASFVPSGIGGGLGGGADIPAASLRAYRAAAEVLAREAPGCGIDWALLAGIGRVEANHGRFGGAMVSEQGVSIPRILGPRLDGSLANTQVIRDSDGGTLDGDTSYDRAVGPMQFLPGTWKRWGSDGDRDGTANPQDIDDAALAAARYLCEGRSGMSDPAQAALAVRRYNNSGSYVDLVLATAAGYRSGVGLGFDPFGVGFDSEEGDVDLLGFSPFDSPVPPPPGWALPPGTMIGAGPLDPVPPAPTASAPAPGPTGPTVTPRPPEPTTGPTDAPSSPGTPTTGPTGTPSDPSTGEPSGSPTTSPGPSEVPTTAVPSEPGCEPASSSPPPSAPVLEPGGTPSLAPCPVPCGSTPPSATSEPVPSASATCAPVTPTGWPSP